MEKLRDAKKIKWKESYTPKTDFLRRQFNAVVGKGSYKRWEGNEVGGPGKWYVIVSPADVHEHRRAKFFAGVRKLPDSYPAGGKYFDTIREAYEYAYETWGAPKPQDIPPFTAGDLKGIAKRIDKWKEENKDSKEKKEASVPFDVFRIKTAMALGKIKKIPLFFDIRRFVPILENIDMSDPKDSDKLYEGILALSSFKTRKAVEEELAKNESTYGDLAKSTLDNGKTYEWKRENRGLANPAYKEVTNVLVPGSETGPVVDNFFDIAALICTIGRINNESCVREFLFVTGKLKDSEDAKSIDRRAYRSNFEEGILSAWQKYNFNVRNLEECYDFSYYMWTLYNLEQENKNEKIISYDEFKKRIDSDKSFAEQWTLKREDYPISMFIEYGRRDSATGYWIASPYTSNRAWDKRIMITENEFSLDEYGLCSVDYAILNGFGLKRPEKITKEFATAAKAKMLELGNIPEQIKSYLKSGEVKGGGIKNRAILNRDFTPREFGFVIEEIKKILPSGSEKVVKGLVEAFTGWVMFVGGQEERMKDGDFQQEIKAKAMGCMYGGRKAVTNMMSRESLVGLLQEESGTIFSLRQAPVGALVASLSNLKNLTHDNAPKIQAFSEKLMSLNKDTVGFDEAVKIANSSGLSGMLTKEDIVFLFGEALQSGNEIPIYPEYSKTKSKRSIVNDITKRFIGGTSQMIKTNGVSAYLNDKTLDRTNLSPRQKAILQYSEGAGWNRIYDALSSLGYVFVKGNTKKDLDQEKLFAPRIVITRILRQQAEKVLVDGKEVTVRVFTDDDIRRFLNSYKKRTSSTSFLGFKKDLEEGDVTISVFTNGDGLVMSRLSLTDYLYWKIMMNRFKHSYNLIDDNPQLYEDILRTYFVPNDPKLIQQIDEIGAVKFFIDGKQVTTDSNGNRLIFFGGTIRAIDKSGKSYAVSESEKISTEITDSPEENCYKIEEALASYFSDKKKRKSYNLLSSFASRHVASKLYHPQLLLARSKGIEGRDLSSALKQLSSVQQKVIVEVARDMVSGFDPSNPDFIGPKLISDPSYDGDKMSPAQLKLVESIRTAIQSPDQLECFKMINSAFKSFSNSTGQTVPFIIKNYLRKYNQQISPSVVTAKMSSTLGYHAFIETPVDDSKAKGGKSNVLKDVGSNFDITKNATNAAIVLNSFFVEHCRKLSLCEDSPDVFNVSEAEYAQNKKKFMINSKQLSICHYLGTTKDPEEVQKENVSKIQNTFSMACNASALLTNAVANAVTRRYKTPPLAFDPYISVDSKGKKRRVWYHMAMTPDWGAKSIIITANVLTNWIHNSIPDQNSTKVTPEILSGILKCSIPEANNILNLTLSSHNEFEKLEKDEMMDSENIKNMAAAQGVAEATSEMTATEVNTSNIALTGTVGVTDDEDEDAGAIEALEEEKKEKIEKSKDLSKKKSKKSKKPVDINNANTSIEEVVPGVPDTASDEVPISLPGEDPNALSDAAEIPVSVEVESSDIEYVPDEPVDIEGMDKNIAGFLPPGNTDDPESPVDVSDYDSDLIPTPPSTQIEEQATSSEIVDDKSDLDTVVTEGEIPSKPIPNIPPTSQTDKPSSKPSPPPPLSSDNDVTKKTPIYEVVHKSPDPIVSKPVVQTGPNKKKGPKPPPPPPKSAYSLLNLVRVAKSYIDKGEYEKADAINKFVSSKLITNVSSSESRKLAFMTLSNLISVSKSLQKEGKHDDAVEINQIVKRHLDRLREN